MRPISSVVGDSETEAKSRQSGAVIGLCGLVPTQRRSFVPARERDRCGPERGPMNVPGLGEKNRQRNFDRQKRLHRHLLPNGTVIRTKFGAYALAGTQPPYISKCDAIIAALKKGPMTVPILAQVTCTTPASLYQLLIYCSRTVGLSAPNAAPMR